MKTTKIKWRLSNLPNVEEVGALVQAQILTKDEAREILFSLETEEERTKKSLQEEIKFLRELVAKMTTSRSVIVENIRYVEKPYRNQDWYQPYISYYSSSGTAGAIGSSGSSGSAVYAMQSTSSLGGTGILTGSNSTSTNSPLGGPSAGFTDIKTF